MKLGTANPSGGYRRRCVVGTFSRREIVGQQDHAVLSAKPHQLAQVFPAGHAASGGPMGNGGGGLEAQARLDLLAGYPGALQAADCIGVRHGYGR